LSQVSVDSRETETSLMDRSYVVWAYWMIALIAGVGIIAWGYRADRKSVLFPWNRYWHWWRVSIIYGSIAAAGVIPVAG
jgi:hypothetical protein